MDPPAGGFAGGSDETEALGEELAAQVAVCVAWGRMGMETLAHPRAAHNLACGPPSRIFRQSRIFRHVGDSDIVSEVISDLCPVRWT
jgi:hypothetical protein